MLCLILYLIFIAIVSLPHEKILGLLILISHLRKPNNLLHSITLSLCRLLLVLNSYRLKFELLLIFWPVPFSLCWLSLSTLSQHDSLLTYYLIFKKKINLSYFVEAFLNPSSLPYGVIITHILEDSNISLELFPSFVIKQFYYSKDFTCMGFMFVDDIWVHKSNSDSTSTPTSRKSKSSPPPSPHIPLDITTHLTQIELKFESIKDLLLSTYLS